MKIIPMEDFVLRLNKIDNEYSKTLKNTVFSAGFKNACLDYANFLKTPMRHEHFFGPAAIVKIENVDVLKFSADDTDRGLLFTPNEDFSGGDSHPIQVPSGEMFTSLSQSGYNCELTDHGVKLIFG